MTQESGAPEYGAPAPPKPGIPVWAWCLIIPCGCMALSVPILAAILFPVFAQAHEKARATSCMSNLKQQSLGVLMYVEDFDEKFPSAEKWMDKMGPKYIKDDSVFHCPSVCGEPDGVWIRVQQQAFRSDVSQSGLARHDADAVRFRPIFRETQATRLAVSPIRADIPSAITSDTRTVT